MTSCAYLKSPDPILPPADLAAPCPDLPAFTGTTNKALFLDDLKVTALYQACQLKHNKLSDLLNPK